LQVADLKFEYYLLLAVLRVATKMDTNSSTSPINGLMNSRFTIPLSERISSQYKDSSASSRTMPIFEMKSAFECPRQAAR
jgi:hypothetical protein